MKNQLTFRLYGVSLRAAQLVTARIALIARHDSDLGRQARRALNSMHLNIVESIDARGGIRRQRMRTALGSTNEVIACLDLGDALGYAALDEDAIDALGHVRATLLKLVMAKR